jgi:hypothetical protein
MRSVKSVWLLGLVVSACSSTVDFGSIAGKWAEDFSVPGSSMGMDLTAYGSVVSGSGNWCGEAGPCGTIGVTGTIDGAAVHLDLSFTQTLPQPAPARIEHFDGRLTSPTGLQGSITSDTPGQPTGHIGFHRA